MHLRTLLPSLGCWAVLTWVAGCGGGMLGDPVDLASQEGVDVEADEGTAPPRACGGDVPHVVDGKFTGWSGPGDPTHEWTTGMWLQGQLGVMHADVCGTTLFFLNDWHLNVDGPIDPACYNLFFFNLSGGLFEIRLFGDQHIEVLYGGEPYQGWSQGATTFSTSPEFPEARHTIFEFALQLPGRGTFSMCELDPSSTSNCETDDQLVAEPTILKGTINADGTIDASGEAAVPFVTGMSPLQAAVGDLVVVRGLNLSDVAGTVRVGGVPATVVVWGDREVRFVVPQVALGERAVRLFAGEIGAPAVTLTVVCVPACADRECGDDGCGGDCGSCAGSGSAAVCVDGACACTPSCAGRVCGDDGCGGSCGSCVGTAAVCTGGACSCTASCLGRDCGDDGCSGSCGGCGPAEMCSQGACVCAPDCAGKQCGTNNCGGTCGTCAAGEQCQQWQCVCEPQCQDRTCGPDGCNGVCGLCPRGRPCVDGKCQCLPDCDGKVCGDDGCGGSCGACQPGTGCVNGVCACLPNCLNRDCGDDACGGVCGVCDADEVCVGAHCQCVPQCDGKSCGDDGCGGSCGACPAGFGCVNAACVCLPQCQAFGCGDDGCGGSCGTCAEGTVCDGGQCVCVPDCSGKQCGDDTCGGSCGTCPEGQECAKNFQCMTP